MAGVTGLVMTSWTAPRAAACWSRRRRNTACPSMHRRRRGDDRPAPFDANEVSASSPAWRTSASDPHRPEGRQSRPAHGGGLCAAGRLLPGQLLAPAEPMMRLVAQFSGFLSGMERLGAIVIARVICATGAFILATIVAMIGVAGEAGPCLADAVDLGRAGRGVRRPDHLFPRSPLHPDEADIVYAAFAAVLLFGLCDRPAAAPGAARHRLSGVERGRMAQADATGCSSSSPWRC